MGYRLDGLRAWKQVNNGPIVYFYYDGERLTLEITQPHDQNNQPVVSRQAKRVTDCRYFVRRTIRRNPLRGSGGFGMPEGLPLNRVARENVP